MNNFFSSSLLPFISDSAVCFLIIGSASFVALLNQLTIACKILLARLALVSSSAWE